MVLVLSNYVIKIPKHWKGIKANRSEYFNFCKAPKNTVAITKLFGIFIIQERLYNTQIFKRKAIREEIPDYATHLFDIKINNRLQIGQNGMGIWKIFDYEDIKYLYEIGGQIKNVKKL